MDASWKLSGFGEVRAKLRNIADRVPEKSRKTMHRAADRVEKLAKLQCPHDTGALEASIRQEVIYDERRRLAIDIVAGGEAIGDDGKMVDVSDYAIEVEENYESMPNTPGIHTLEKAVANPGVLIGSKFLERALEPERTRLYELMIEDVMEVVEQEGLKG